MTQGETMFLPEVRASEIEIMRLRSGLVQQPLVAIIVNGLPDGAVILNAERQIVLANTAFVQFTGRTEDTDVVGLRPGEAVGCIHAREMSGCGTTEFCRHCGAAQVLEQSRLDRKAAKECRIMTESGDGIAALDLLVWGTPFNYGGDKYIFFSIRDISHEKRRRVLERVFFHDILNTTGALSGLSKLLLKKAPQHLERLTRPISEATGILLNEIRAQKQIHDAESNDLQVTPESIQSLEYLERLADMYAGHRMPTGIEMELVPDAANLGLVTDPVLLNRVMSNLINNAVEASEAGMTVTVDCRGARDGVVFAVHNPGSIPRDVQLQLFKRSFSTKGPGRGLGLYSVKLLTERYLRGRVDFASSREDGTGFSVTLPHNLPE